jgi:hypothetical protein
MGWCARFPLTLGGLCFKLQLWPIRNRPRFLRSRSFYMRLRLRLRLTLRFLAGTGPVPFRFRSGPSPVLLPGGLVAAKSS